MSIMQQCCPTNKRQPFRNLVCVAVLALSCTHAFVVSSRQNNIDSTARGGAYPLEKRHHVHRQRSPTMSQLNVMQIPPVLQTSTFPEEGDDNEGEVANGNELTERGSDKHAGSIKKRNGYHDPRLALLEETVVDTAYSKPSRTTVPLRNGRQRLQRNNKSSTATSSKVKQHDGRLFQQSHNGADYYSSDDADYRSKATNGIAKTKKDAVFVAETKLPSEYGKFRLRAYRVPGEPIGKEPCVIYAQDKPPMGAAGKPAYDVPVRIHDQCITSEVFGSKRCDCKDQLVMSLDYIKKNGGCIIYLQQEGRGIGLANKIAAYSLQDKGFDTVDANLHLGFEEDEREYDIIPSILKDMNIEGIQLMTNNPRKVGYLSALNVNVQDTLPMVVSTVNSHNRKYIETKRTRMNHVNFAHLLNRDETKDVHNGDEFPSIHMMNRRVDLNEASKHNGSAVNEKSLKSPPAIEVSLTVEDVVQDKADAPDEDMEQGVVSGHDGYCFGRQSVEAAIEAIARGEMVVVVDDMDRENEGDFIMAADMCTPMDMARIIRYSSGVVCVALEEDRLSELGLPPMVTKNEDPKGTAFTVTVDASKEHGITTGISAVDRAKTIQLLANPEATATDFHRPGHILPLIARKGGVLTRDGHTEAAIDLSRLANRQPAGVLCEIVSEENPTEMMRLPEIKRFCRRHGHVLTSIADLAQYRRDTGL